MGKVEPPEYNEDGQRTVRCSWWSVVNTRTSVNLGLMAGEEVVDIESDSESEVLVFTIKEPE